MRLPPARRIGATADRCGGSAAFSSDSTSADQTGTIVGSPPVDVVASGPDVAGAHRRDPHANAAAAARR